MTLCKALSLFLGLLGNCAAIDAWMFGETRKWPYSAAFYLAAFLVSTFAWNWRRRA